MRIVLTLALLFAGCGGPAPEVKDGRGVPLSISPGELTALLSDEEAPSVVNFWATWCDPCREELPLLSQSAKDNPSVRFIGINVRDDADAAADFIERFDLDYLHFADPDGRIQTDNKVAGLPVTRFFHRDGTLAFTHAGEIKADELAEKVAELVKFNQ